MARNPGLNTSYAEGMQRELDAIGRERQNVWYVNSGAGNADDDNAGDSWDRPFATIAQSISSGAAGDLVRIAEGHSETTTAAITMSKAGMKFVCAGVGTRKAQITGNHTGDIVSVTADNVVIEGFYWNEATAAATSHLNVAAANFVMRKSIMDCGTNDVDAVTLTAAAERPTFLDNEVFVTANGPDSWLKFEGVIDRPVVVGNHIVGSDGTNAYDDGALDFDSVAVTNPIVYGNTFNGAGAATTIIANGSAVTGAMYANNVYAGSATEADNVGTGDVTQILAELSGSAGIATFPAAAIPANGVSLAEVIRQLYAALEGTAASQNGVATWPTAAAYANNVSIAEVLGYVQDAVRNGSGAAMATNKSIADALGSNGSTITRTFNANIAGEFLALPRSVEKSDGSVTSGTDDLFTITGGPIHVLSIVGIVTTVIGAGTTNVKLQITTTEPAATVDMSAGAVDIDGDAAGTSYSSINTTAVFTPVTAGFVMRGNAFATNETQFLCPIGTIKLNSDATRTGVIKWYLRYVPLSPSSLVVAAA